MDNFSHDVHLANLSLKDLKDCEGKIVNLSL